MPANLKLTIPNFVRVDGYFYHISDTNDTLFKKVDSGENAFSYPLNTDLTTEVKCLQHDGRFFYTLENNTTANSGNGQLLIKKWKIEDFVLKLKRTYTLDGISTKKYNCNSFAIEHFHISFGAVATSGSSTLTLSDNSRVSIGEVLQLGPSTFTGDEGKTEEVTVNSILPANQVTISTPLVNSYNSGDSIDYAKRCWFFNKFRPSDPDPTNGSGQLYSFNLNPVSITVTARKEGNEFRSVLASTFMTDNFYTGGPRDFLVYANQTNLLFIETQDSNINFLSTVQSAAQNNQETNSNVITIYDITHEADTIFRLQTKATYKNGVTSTTEDFGSQYNYQVAPMQRLPLSISLTANPAVISADGVSTSDITAIVKDQFDQAVGGRTVNFSDNDTSGSPQGAMIPTSNVTASGTGECFVDYRAGTEARTVVITATT